MCLTRRDPEVKAKYHETRIAYKAVYVLDKLMPRTAIAPLHMSHKGYAVGIWMEARDAINTAYLGNKAGYIYAGDSTTYPVGFHSYLTKHAAKLASKRQREINPGRISIVKVRIKYPTTYGVEHVRVFRRDDYRLIELPVVVSKYLMIGKEKRRDVSSKEV